MPLPTGWLHLGPGESPFPGQSPLLPAPRPPPHGGRGACPALGSGPLFVRPQHSPWALPLASFTSRSPGTHGVRGGPLPFPALSLPYTVPREKERWGVGVEPGGARWVGTGAASSLCPACSLCQSYRDLLGGPGAFVGAIKVNLLPPGRVRVVLRLAAWGRPGLSGRGSAADPGRRFSPAHREFVFWIYLFANSEDGGRGSWLREKGPGSGRLPGRTKAREALATRTRSGGSWGGTGGEREALG